MKTDIDASPGEAQLPSRLCALAGVVLAWLALSISLRPGMRGRTPNVVFFLADDLGYMDIGANNPQTFYETPSIDGLARKGSRFTQGYAACPVCSPTRASIMTGKFPVRTGITDYIPGQRKQNRCPHRTPIIWPSRK